MVAWEGQTGPVGVLGLSCTSSDSFGRSWWTGATPLRGELLLFGTLEVVRNFNLSASSSAATRRVP